MPQLKSGSECRHLKEVINGPRGNMFNVLGSCPECCQLNETTMRGWSNSVSSYLFRCFRPESSCLRTDLFVVHNSPARVINVATLSNHLLNGGQSVFTNGREPTRD